MDELKQLIERSRDGDLDAFGQVVRRFQDMAHGYAYAVLGDFHLAQDATQEAFIQAYLKLDTLAQPTGFPGWLRRIVLTQCHRITRRKQPETVPIEQLAHMPGPQPQKSEVEEQVLEAIRALPNHQREATTLYYINGYSQKEIADFLEVPVTTVQKRLHDSRKKLKERMLGMVEDTLKGNALPDDFARETVAKAVEEAHRLNKDGQCREAEQILRATLETVPNQPEVLRELNRSLMWGRAYAEGRWDYLPEIVEHGRAILAGGVDDEEVYYELARTLLAVPAMNEAVEFIQGWIGKKGRDLQRLGMLAWAKACTGDYDGAGNAWNEMLERVPSAGTDEIGKAVPLACQAMVDALMAAGKREQAQVVVRETWSKCKDRLIYAEQTYEAGAWLAIMHGADLRDEIQNAGRAIIIELEKIEGPGLRVKLELLCNRVWLEGPDALVPEWLSWVRECIANEEWLLLREGSSAIARTCKCSEAGVVSLAAATAEELSADTREEIAKVRQWWAYVRFERMFTECIQRGDYDAAEKVLREGVAAAWKWAADRGNNLAILRGAPSPLELMERLNGSSDDEVQDIDYWGWYHIAREAAAAGDKEKAFSALRRAARLWCNGPLLYMQNWEKDTRWGELLNSPEFKAILDERRQRIGPIYGQLHYFPGW